MHVSGTKGCQKVSALGATDVDRDKSDRIELKTFLLLE